MKTDFYRIMKRILNCVIVMFFSLINFCFLNSCSDSKDQDTLNHAETLIETSPDSAFYILQDIDTLSLQSKRDKARYALLMSMALDKNYIDTTTFDVLKPALDYYPQKGNPDEKLRTYYYQGRIYQNQGEREKALDSFERCTNTSAHWTDSLTMIRALISQAIIYYDLYDLPKTLSRYLKAADLSKKLSHDTYEFMSLLGALNSSIMLGEKIKADSLINECDKLEFLNKEQKEELFGYKISYSVNFGSKKDMDKLLASNSYNLSCNTMTRLDMANGYNAIGENRKAKALIDSVAESNLPYDTLKYLALSVCIAKDMGNYREALSLYEDFTRRMDAQSDLMFAHKTQTIEDRHRLEAKAREDARRKSTIIWGCVFGIIILAMGIVILMLLVRSNKAKAALAIQKEKTTALENRNLQSEKERLALENLNLQLERDKKSLEAENLSHRISQLEDESEILKNALQSSNEIPTEVRDTMQIRLGMLNALLANYITDNDKYSDPYDKWIENLTKNTEEFMNSNRLAYKASHPKFIQYFEDHGLTEGEINYVCLYAMGLNGREVGNYLKKPSHVNLSSAIRKKLGIDKHETNIGIYVRKLLKNL